MIQRIKDHNPQIEVKKVCVEPEIHVFYLLIAFLRGKRLCHGNYFGYRNENQRELKIGN